MSVNYLQANEQSRRYDALSTQCRIVSGQQDLNSFLRFLQPDSPKVPRKAYAPPQSGPGDADDVLAYSVSECFVFFLIAGMFKFKLKNRM